MSQSKSAKARSEKVPTTALSSKTTLGLAAGLVACAFILLVLVVGWNLERGSSEDYYVAVQEDELLEWATAWSFLLAAMVAGVAASAQWRSTRTPPWFVLGVGLFCFVVGMEEISWGQRILGFRPPDYFLENNFQQELNVHNVMSTDLRKLAVKAVVLGYGVLLPLLVLVPGVPKLLGRIGVLLPPLTLVPGFVATFWLYQSYPWSFTGEWVELMMGLGFLFAMLAAWMTLRHGEGQSRKARAAFTRRSLLTVSVSAVLVVGLGFINASISRAQRAGSEEIVETARQEIEALRRDFSSGRGQTRCNLHKRVYTFVQEYGQNAMQDGEFAALEQQGLPESRAEYFLDPWNSPYWIRDRCSKSRKKRLIFVYSFGPNRRRDSSRYEILGDDVGAWIRQQPLD